MPSLLVTFALQWRAGDRGIGVKPPSREGVVSVTMLPIVEPPSEDVGQPIDLVPYFYPALIRMREPGYPAPLRRAGIEGRVVLKGVVDTHGRVKRSSIVVLQATEPRFAARARQALGAAVFRRALGGEPAEPWVTVVFDFTLSEGTGRAR
jgi:TonB family protein